MSLRFHSTGQDNWRGKTPHYDWQRHHMHGALQPMEQPRRSIWARIIWSK